MKIFLFVFAFVFVSLFLFVNHYNCVKVKKNKGLRHLLEYLTEREYSAEGENEFARLTQAPIVKMNLSKSVYKTSLQNILVKSYSEKVKEEIAQMNYEINKEKTLLEELNNSLHKINTLNMIMLENENKELLTNKIRNKYAHYLLNTENEDIFYYPVYKTLKVNSAHYLNALNASLTPSELLEKGELSHEQFIKQSHNRLLFPERGDNNIHI